MISPVRPEVMMSNFLREAEGTRTVGSPLSVWRRIGRRRLCNCGRGASCDFCGVHLDAKGMWGCSSACRGAVWAEMGLFCDAKGMRWMNGSCRDMTLKCAAQHISLVILPLLPFCVMPTPKGHLITPYPSASSPIPTRRASISLVQPGHDPTGHLFTSSSPVPCVKPAARPQPRADRPDRASQLFLNVPRN